MPDVPGPGGAGKVISMLMAWERRFSSDQRFHEFSTAASKLRLPGRGWGAQVGVATEGSALPLHFVGGVDGVGCCPAKQCRLQIVYDRLPVLF